MSVLGIDEITFGAQDIARCRQFFLDWGLTLVEVLIVHLNARLAGEIETFVDQYYGVPLAQLSLGGMLSDVAMCKRDHLVFQAFQGKPLVWNLAGGYQRDSAGGIEPVLRLHRNTVQALRVYQS